MNGAAEGAQADDRSQRGSAGSGDRVRDEAHLLAEAVRSWWDDHGAGDGDTHSDGGGANDTADAAAGEHDCAARSSCRVCPVCRLLDQLRATRPEAVAQVSTAAGDLLTALRDLFGAPPGRPPDHPPDHPPGRSGRQRIDLDPM